MNVLLLLLADILIRILIRELLLLRTGITAFAVLLKPSRPASIRVIELKYLFYAVVNYIFGTIENKKTNMRRKTFDQTRN